jgi:dihydroflavonol-4-reductase
MSRTILVTGATGYIAKHIVLQLLERGDRVRGSVRSDTRADELRAAMRAHLSDPGKIDNLSTVLLDLTEDEGWGAAMEGVDALLHTASPFPLVQPADEDDVIRPAVDGAVRALRAAQAAGVRRVVLTSSVVAVQVGSTPTAGQAHSEADWTDPDHPEATAYAKSKTLAERAAWDFVESSGGAIEMTAINPAFVMGPPLDGDFGTSVQVIARILAAKDPMIPNIGFNTVDVRDVALAHIRALDLPASVGQRIIVSDRWMWFRDMAEAIAEALPGRRIPTRVAPDFVIRFLGLFDPAIRSIKAQLGKREELTNARARDVLGIDFRDSRVAVQDTARWLVETGRA